MNEVKLECWFLEKSIRFNYAVHEMEFYDGFLGGRHRVYVVDMENRYWFEIGEIVHVYGKLFTDDNGTPMILADRIITKTLDRIEKA